MHGRGRQVVRVAGVLGGRDVRRQSLISPSSRNQPAISCWMSYSVVATPSRRRCATASKARSLTRYSLSDAWRCVVDRVRVPDGGEALDQIAGRDDLGARLTHQLDRAGVDARDIRDRARGEYSIATRRDAGQQRAQAGLELIAAGVLRSSCPAGARASSFRSRGPGRAARRWRESGSTSGAWRDGRPGGRPPVTSAAIGFRPRKS